MQPLMDHPFADAVCRYLRSRRESIDPFTAEDIRQSVVKAAPEKERWYLCEVDGCCYAVRISRHDRIELMSNMFHHHGLAIAQPRT